MTLWIIFGLMTAVALVAAGWPLARSRASASGASDVAVYRDQLEEIERDRADGRIGHDEFEAARIEVSRRLLSAAASTGAASSTAAAAPHHWRRFVALAGVVIAVPLVAVPFYNLLGSPELTGEALASRDAGDKDGAGKEAPSIAVLIARIEKHLKENPNDSRGWEVIAPVYMRLERYDDAVNARRNLLSLLGPSAQREADLGVALAMAAGGEVTPDAKSAFERAMGLDSGNVNAMFFLGIAAQQGGNGAEAARIWRDLIAKAPPDAPWLPAVRERLAGVSNDPAPAPPGGYALAARPPGPTSEDVAAARGMTPEARGQMIGSMVQRLAARLREDGTDVNGWLRLLHAYMVLGERDKAIMAAREAREALAREPEKLKLLDAGLRDDEVLKDLAVRE